MREWVFTILTKDPVLARAADIAGIDRIGVDLEILGKPERQQGLGTMISGHSEQDAHAVFPEIRSGARFARVNPVNPGTKAEIEALLLAGVQVLMLPYFFSIRQVEIFAGLVGRRAMTVGLVETIAALGIVDDIIRLGLLTEIHFGLTDLGIDMRMTRPEILRDPRFLESVALVRRSEMPFGIAGFARPGDTALAYDPGTFITEIAGLGASRALIARSFLRSLGQYETLADDVSALRGFLGQLG